jgi:hypothetical protein
VGESFSGILGVAIAFSRAATGVPPYELAYSNNKIWYKFFAEISDRF